MVLIFGGAYQGKSDFALRTFGLEEKDLFFCTVDNTPDWGAKALCNAEQLFLQLTKNNVDVVRFLSDNIDKLEDKIITVNDVSQGVVPIDSTLRAWRVATGRAMLFLASNSCQVYRVFCGIEERIK